MNSPKKFTEWLFGYLNANNLKTLNPEQTQEVKAQLALVFNKVTPQRTLEKMAEDLYEEPTYCKTLGNKGSTMQPNSFGDENTPIFIC